MPAWMSRRRYRQAHRQAPPQMTSAETLCDPVTRLASAKSWHEPEARGRIRESLIAFEISRSQAILPEKTVPWRRIRWLLQHKMASVLLCTTSLDHNDYVFITRNNQLISCALERQHISIMEIQLWPETHKDRQTLSAWVVSNNL